MSQLVKRNGTLFPLLSDFFDTDKFFSSWPELQVAEIPSANITEREKDFLVELAAPGLEKKDFKVELEENMLTISAEKEQKSEEKKNGTVRKEFSYNSFCRSFRLPENSKADKIEAAYENGILKIEIPKKEISVSKPKKEIAVA